MKSKLPEQMESKRRALAAEHNRSVLLFAPFYFLAAFASFYVARNFVAADYQALALLALAVPLISALYLFVFRLRARGLRRSVEIGYVCPHCGAPLYMARSLTHVTGECPKCKKSLV